MTPPPERAASPASAVVVLDRDAVRAVDRLAIDEFGIPGLVLMENAARGVAEQAMRMLADHAGPPRVLIICGSGNNGGDGYALARHLHNRAVDVVIAALGQPQPKSDAGVNRVICEKMRLTIIDADQLLRADGTSDSAEYALIVDAIFGTGLDRQVAGAAAELIRWINGSERPVLAVDVPSGLDCDSGQPLGACVRASATVTFVGMKSGFLELAAQKWLGEVSVADIGVPRELVERLGRRAQSPRQPDAPERGIEDPTPARPGVD